MKLIFSVLLITLTSALPIEDDNHYVQHQSSVDNAKARMNERLAALSSRVGSQLQNGYNSQCSTCTNGYSSSQSQSSRSSSSQSSAMSSGSSAKIVEGSDYVGVGYVGHAAAGDQDDVQVRVSPSISHGSQSRFSSSNAAYEEEDTQQRLVAPDLDDSQAYYLRQREDDQSHIGYHDLSVNNEGNYDATSRTVVKPQVYYVPAPVSSSTSQRASESSNQQRYSVSVRPGTVIRLPVTVIRTPGTQEYNSQTNSGSSYQASGTETRPTNVYTVPSNTVTYTDRRIPAQPEKYRTSDANYNSYTQSRNEDAQESETYQTRLVPERVQYDARTSGGSTYQTSGTEARPTYTVYHIPSTSNTERQTSSGSQYDLSRTTVQRPERYRAPDLSSYNTFNSRSQNEDTDSYQTRVSPTITDQRSSSITSQRTAEEQEQRRYTPSRPNYVQRTSSGHSESESESLRSENSRIYSPLTTTLAPYVRTYSSQQRQQQQQSESSRIGNTYSPYSPSYGTSSTSSRMGTGVAHSSSDNLYDYMSESERLARLQQQQVASSGQSSSSTASRVASVAEANRRTMDRAQQLDSAAFNFVGSTNLGSRSSGDLDTGLPAGYQRTKSWQKQSQWESGSQYGSDGKPTSFSKISTAESERHNLNGAETGYKAATTTLENDGKVSTYSIHTP